MVRRGRCPLLARVPFSGPADGWERPTVADKIKGRDVRRGKKLEGRSGEPAASHTGRRNSFELPSAIALGILRRKTYDATCMQTEMKRLR